MSINLNNEDLFEHRHNGSNRRQTGEMLDKTRVRDIHQLIEETIPADIRLKNPLQLPEPVKEYEFLRIFRSIAEKNKIYKSYIGLGYYDCIVPPVIQRNILENPGWYTAYTPYQAEISQGRLEALINFQTMVSDLTAMEIANASLLDEGTAAAEAMIMLHALRKPSKKKSETYLVDDNIFPPTLDVLKTRAAPLGIKLVTGNLDIQNLEDPDLFGILIQYPDSDGRIRDHRSVIEKAKSKDLMIAFSADLQSLALIVPPGELGADVVTGNTQRFGVPMGFGGPHAAYFATREEYKRLLPGRIIGASVDAKGKKAYRMALQTREQHIRREKATSNICTAQVLLAVMAGAYAVYHGADGLRKIATRIHKLALLLEKLLTGMGFQQINDQFYDTLKIPVSSAEKDTIRAVSESQQINFRYFEDNHIGISVDETTSFEDIRKIAIIFSTLKHREITSQLVQETASALPADYPDWLKRSSGFLTHPVFQKYRTEHEMLRYLKSLENKDLSLVHSMISLGSCTMKLNATTEMIPVTWPELAQIHPFAPQNQVEGYLEIFRNLESWLNEITGFAATSLQPNSGAQGEYTGLMVIRAYYESRGESQRNVVLIPTSAHGTNPASAVMAGMQVVLVPCDELGNIDINDLRTKAEQHQQQLSALMVTYPSTHGVFEESIHEICEIIHRNGGQVYMDGANMNAQVGLTNPFLIGADVCHLNLHKTFCIPHGGGGPGMGPICVASHLAPFLPGNPVVRTGGKQAIRAVSSAPWGSAGILAISYAYIRMMGQQGLTNATRLAILNANYVKSRLEKYYPILYRGSKGRVAHEFILDCREFKKTGIEVEDIAKRLMDYSFHAPTVSFPVPGTMMIEPTESESKEELDRFCDALIEIYNEIMEVKDGKADKVNNVLKNAPHTYEVAVSDSWDYPYSREKAVFPLPYLRNRKFWPSVSRIDNAYGDRNLFCTCLPVEEYAEEVAK